MGSAFNIVTSYGHANKDYVVVVPFVTSLLLNRFSFWLGFALAEIFFVKEINF